MMSTRIRQIQVVQALQFYIFLIVKKFMKGEGSTSHIPPEEGPEIPSPTHYFIELKEDGDEREGSTTQLLPNEGPAISSSTQLTVGIEEVHEEREEASGATRGKETTGN